MAPSASAVLSLKNGSVRLFKVDLNSNNWVSSCFWTYNMFLKHVYKQCNGEILNECNLFPTCHNWIKSALAFRMVSVLAFSLPRGCVCIIFKQTVHLCKNTAACLQPQILLNLPLSFSSKLTGVCEYGESGSGSCIQLFPGALHISGECRVWSRGRGAVMFGGGN